MFGMSAADIIRIVLMGIFILVCIALSIVVLMQESKQQGLSGTISGAADTYWGRNKGRSMEGKLVLFTKILGVAFFVLAAILNINFYKETWILRKTMEGSGFIFCRSEKYIRGWFYEKTRKHIN